MKTRIKLILAILFINAHNLMAHNSHIPHQHESSLETLSLLVFGILTISLIFFHRSKIISVFSNDKNLE